MKKLALACIALMCFELPFAQCLPEEKCTYIFHLLDFFGDGWNGNSMTVYQNGAVIALLDMEV